MHNKKKLICPSGGSIQFHAHEPTSNGVSKSLASGTSKKLVKAKQIIIDKK
jgi:hypothetical protein